MKNLKIFRFNRGLTQEDIAKVLNIKRSQYARYELGENEMPIRHYITLAKFYGITLDELCGLIDSKNGAN